MSKRKSNLKLAEDAQNFPRSLLSSSVLFRPPSDRSLNLTNGP